MPCLPQSLSLSGALTLARCEEHQADLRAALDKGEGVELVVSAQDEPDLAFVQLLVAAQRSAAARGQTFRFASPPTGPLAEALRSCGFRFAAGETSLDRIFAPQVGATR